MRKLLNIFVSLIMVSLLLSTNVVETQASGYDMQCSGNMYELDTANANGTFTKKQCYSDFYTAKAALSSDNDVIRHSSSLSPMKIIAIKTGVAYSYPQRSGSLTLAVSQYIGSGKSVSVTYSRELVAKQVQTYDGDGHGYYFVSLNGFTGYVDIANIDLIPQIFIDNQVKVAFGGNVSGDIISQDAYYLIPNRSFYSAVTNGNYYDLVFTWYQSSKTTSETMTTYSIAIGEAPSWMQANTKYYSQNGYDYYSDYKYQSYVATYYPYYVYLPLRSTTSVSVDVFDKYLTSVIGSNQSALRSTGQTFIDSQNKYGVNALMTFAMACLESANGTSSIATTKNNLFGWNAVDTSPGQSANYFSSVSDCITEQMWKNLRGYLDAFDSRYFGSHLGNKGSGFNVCYATDSYWGYKIAAIAYSIDKLDNGNDGSLTDYDKYDLYVANTFGAKLYRESALSTKLYSLDYGGVYQEANVQIATKLTSSYAVVQSSNIVDSNGDPVKHSSGATPKTEYNFATSIGYMNLLELSKINNTSVVDNQYVTQIDAFSLASGYLSISGKAYQPNIKLSSVNDLTHTLLIKNSGQTVKSITLDQNASTGDYVAAGFKKDKIDLSDLAVGKTYTLSINTVGSSYTKETNIVSVTNTTITTATKQYKVVSDATATSITVSAYTAPTNDPSVVPTNNPDDYTGYNVKLQTYEISDDAKLHIAGYAYVENHNNGKDKVSHSVIVTDLNTGKIKDTIVLTTQTGANDISDYYVDDYDYSYAYYDGIIDISKYSVGQYKFTLMTTVDGQSYYKDIRINYNDPDTVTKNISNLYYTLKKQYYFSYRIELSIEKANVISDESTTLPSYRETYIVISDLSHDTSTNHLVLAGSSLIWKGTFNAETKPQYTLFLINSDTGSVYQQSVSGVSQDDTTLGDIFTWNQTKEINDGTDYSNSWFKFDMDLNTFDTGTYYGILKVATSKYTDYIDVKSRSKIDMISESTNAKSLNTLLNTTNKNIIQFEYVTGE